MLFAIRMHKISKRLHTVARILWDNAERVGQIVATVVAVVGLAIAGAVALMIQCAGDQPTSEPALGELAIG